MHAGFSRLVEELNRLYRASPRSMKWISTIRGFEWIDIADVEKSVISFLRRAKTGPTTSSSPVTSRRCRASVMRSACRKPGYYREILNSDAAQFGGSNWATRAASCRSPNEERHGRPCTSSITLPPLAVVAFKKLPMG
jgi:1,4-alpha-glucan branching enzyme